MVFPSQSTTPYGGQYNQDHIIKIHMCEKMIYFWILVSPEILFSGIPLLFAPFILPTTLEKSLLLQSPSPIQMTFLVGMVLLLEHTL